jgi:hypothetical protein
MFQFLARFFSRSSRRDPAYKTWHADPSRYHPTFTVSADPLCPYCQASLGQRKPPTRRSTVSCKSCGNLVYVDPKHHIFASVYLNAKQGLIAKTLGKLDSCPATAGKTEDFWWTASELDWAKGKTTLTENEAGDVLWSLMNYNVMHMRKIIPKNEPYDFYVEELQRWLQEYRHLEKEANATLKRIQTQKKQQGGKLDSRLDMVCPYCQAALGKVPIPSKNSSRQCKKCKQPIYVKAKPRLFGHHFLSDKEQLLESTFDQLDHWVFTDGSLDTYHALQHQLFGDKEVTLKDKVKIIKLLLKENIDALNTLANEQYQQDLTNYKELGSILGKPKKDKELLNLVKSLRTSFNDELRQWKASE